MNGWLWAATILAAIGLVADAAIAATGRQATDDYSGLVAMFLYTCLFGVPALICAVIGWLV